jgi:hypothetical protein
MSTGNPLEQLRRRMQSHATPAAFAALAEEHRRAGRLAEAMEVCRDGLERYPAYVSARVTLGRALLDSGDVAGALAELEQAAAQAPDNLAAARALALAYEAAGAAPPPVPPGPPVDLPLRAVEDPVSVSSGLVVAALTAGPDHPQEFGLDADWSIPDAPAPLSDREPVSPQVAPAAGVCDAGPATEAILSHAEALTMCLAPQHLQGEEPAGIWPVPATPPTPSTSVMAGPASVWDALTFEALAADVVPAPAVVVSETWTPDSADEAADLASPAHPASDLPDGSAEAAADRPCFWTGVFGGESDLEAPPPFSGWGDPPAPLASDAGLSSWAEGDADHTGGNIQPDGPSAAWALGAWPESSDPAQARVEAASASLPAEVAWVGSVRSALGEVYARAGHGQSLEPPSHPSPAVNTAMAEAAVEAAIEDAVLRDDVATPALLSLQQMLASVRARRAALAHHSRP